MVEVNWTNIGKAEIINISKAQTKTGFKYSYFDLSFSCKPGLKFWPLPDISMTDEEELDEEEHGKTSVVPKDFIKYEKDKLLEIRLEPLSLMRPLNLPVLDCVKAYHRE